MEEHRDSGEAGVQGESFVCALLHCHTDCSDLCFVFCSGNSLPQQHGLAIAHNSPEHNPVLSGGNGSSFQELDEQIIRNAFS